MSVRDYGFPSRTFFELYNGQCNGRTADKLYSIQVAEWKEFFAKPVWDNVQHDVYEKPDRMQYTPTAAVVDVDVSDQSIIRGEHIRVVPTVALAAFLNSKGFSCPNEIWINPDALAWKEYGEPDPETGEPFIPTPDDESYGGTNKSNSKVFLAALVAIVSLLS